MKTAKNYIPESLVGGHKTITWAAMQSLPEWQRDLWASEQFNLADVYSLYGDTYYTRKEALGRFVELPDGSVPLCGIGILRLRKHYGFAIDFWESPFYERHEQVLTYFLQQIAENVAAGNIHDAAQFAGNMAHLIEDSGVPAHSVDHGDLEFVKDYLQPSKKFIGFPLHGYTELAPKPFLINDYRPRLYGTTPAEAGANYLQRYIQLSLYARSLLFPLAKCAYSGRDAKADALRLKAARMCAYAFADYLYTATCIGKQRFDDALTAIKMVKLTDLWPYRQTAWAPAPYFEPGPLMLRGINLNMERKPVPCELLMPAKNGVNSRRFREALGAGAYFEYHYKVAAGIYSRFTAWVGVHSVLGARRSITIEIKINGQTAFQDNVFPGKPALRVDINARGCRDIQLISSGPWLTDPDGNNNHVVWAEPRLTCEASP